VSACGCIGPQNGEPLCPCQMRGVQIRDGRYVRTQDLGPVRSWGPLPSFKSFAEKLAAAPLVRDTSNFPDPEPFF
jgi:hypothetical protein